MVSTEMTPAEITDLECRIAEGVMGWHWCPSCTALMQDGLWLDEDGDDAAPYDWSPWNDPAAALEVLKQIVKQNPPEIPAVAAYKISCYASGFDVSLPWRGLWAHAPGPHYGPAVCRLAEKVLNAEKT